jgi:hypothetical protein
MRNANIDAIVKGLLAELNAHLDCLNCNGNISGPERADKRPGGRFRLLRTSF